MQSKPKVFIHYSWDSEEHKERVKNFVDELRCDELEIVFDGDNISTPMGGLLSWMKRSIKESDLIIVICTQRYFQIYENGSFSEGLGVQWEQRFIKNDVYTGKKDISQFFPIFLENEEYQNIPSDFSVECQSYTISDIEVIKNALLDKWKKLKPTDTKFVEILLNSDETKNIKEFLESANIENLQKIAYSYLPTNRIGTLHNNISAIIDALLNIGKLENGSIPAICFFNDLNTSQYDVMLDEYLQYLKRHWNISTIHCESNPIVDECSLIIDIDFKDGQNDKYEISVWKYANGKIESQEDIGGVFDIKTFLDKVFDLSVKLNVIYKNIYFEIVLSDELLTDKLCEWSDSRGIKLIQKSKYLQRFQSRFRQPSQELINKCNQLSAVANCVNVSKKASVSTYNHDITDADLLYFCDKTIDNFDELKEHIDIFGIPIVILPTNDNCKFESTLLASNPHELKEKLCAYRMNNISNDNSKFLFIYDDTDKIPEHYKKPQINLYGW